MSHYKTLGVENTATAAEIKTAFRNLAKKYHPDRNPGDPSAEACFKEISNAFEILGDTEKRARYDSEQNAFKFHSGPFHNTGTGTGPNFSSGPAYDDILASILRARAQRGAHGFPEYDNVKNRDIQLSYNITLEEAFSGKEGKVRYKIGAESKEMNIKIPPGIQSGIKIRYPGQGDQAAKAVPPGDLFVTVNIIPHTVFERNGDDLTVHAAVDYLQAIVGGQVDVPTIDGKTIRIKIPEGTTPGKVVRVMGRGMPGINGRGDLFVLFDLKVPDLTESQKKVISDLINQ